MADTTDFGDRGSNISNSSSPQSDESSPDVISVVVESFNSFADYMEGYLEGEEQEENLSKMSAKKFFDALRNIFPKSKKPDYTHPNESMNEQMREAQEQYDEALKAEKEAKKPEREFGNLAEGILPVVDEIFSSSGNILNFFNLEDNPLSKFFDSIFGTKKNKQEELEAAREELALAKENLLIVEALYNKNLNQLLLPPPPSGVDETFLGLPPPPPVSQLTGPSTPLLPTPPLALPSPPLAPPPPLLALPPPPLPIFPPLLPPPDYSLEGSVEPDTLLLPPPANSLATEDPNEVIKKNVNENFNDLLESPDSTTFGGFLEENVGFGGDDSEKMTLELGPLATLAITAISVAVIALTPFLTEIAQNIGKLIDWFIGDFWESGLFPFIEAVQGPIISISSGISNFVEEVFPKLTRLISEVVDILSGVIAKTLSTIGEVVTEVLSVAGNLLVNILEAIQEGIIAFFQNPVGFISDITNQIVSEMVPQLTAGIIRLPVTVLENLFFPNKQNNQVTTVDSKVDSSLDKMEKIELLTVDTLQVNQIIGISPANSEPVKELPAQTSSNENKNNGSTVNNNTTVYVVPNSKSSMPY